MKVEFLIVIALIASSLSDDFNILTHKTDCTGQAFFSQHQVCLNAPAIKIARDRKT